MRGRTRAPLERLAVDTVFESRDTQYEPGRRIQVIEVLATCVKARCVANPRRPSRVGTVTEISHSTLRTKWRRVEGDPR